MTSILIDLSEDKLLKLKEIAALLGVAPEELARKGVEAMLVNTDTEAVLLANISQELPIEVEKRYLELSSRATAENLTHEEHNELLALVTQVEEMQALRISNLAELAHLHKTTLTEVMESLNIKPRAYE